MDLGVNIRVLEDVPEEGGQMTVWGGALVLAKLLERMGGGSMVKGKTVVELGSGCGLVSMVAALQGT